MFFAVRVAAPVVFIQMNTQRFSPSLHAARRLPSQVCATRVRSSKTCITGDMVPPDNPLAALHACESFARVVAAIVGEERLYPTADELGGLNVHVYGTARRTHDARSSR